MLSITKDMDAYDVAAEIRIERQVHKGSFLLLEGERDIGRFSDFADVDECSIVNCYGRPRLLGAIEILYDEGFSGALGLADADFDRVLGRLKEHEGVIYSSFHDFDIDMMMSGIFDKYIREAGDAAKCQAMGTTSGIISALMEGIKPVSVAKYLNERGNIKYKLRSIHIDRCINGINVVIPDYIDLIFEGYSPTVAEKAAVEGLITTHSSNQFDLLQITNGHDFFINLGMGLRGILGNRTSSQTYGREVEMHFRLSFGERQFKKLDAFSKILEWEVENYPYRILDNALRS